MMEPLSMRDRRQGTIVGGPARGAESRDAAKQGVCSAAAPLLLLRAVGNGIGGEAGCLLRVSAPRVCSACLLRVRVLRALGTFAADATVVSAFGNHENSGGPGALGGYSPAAAQAAAAKYRTYFDVPDNGHTNVEVAPGIFADHTGRYHRVSFGPVTLLTIDSSNGGVDNTASDTNFHLAKSAHPQISDYMPGSRQYQWLETQLAAAQSAGQIVFVQYHHAAYSSGIHGRPAGNDTVAEDTQSGQPLRVITPLLTEYGVKAVFSGHDEMYEHGSWTESTSTTSASVATACGESNPGRSAMRVRFWPTLTPPKCERMTCFSRAASTMATWKST